MTMSSLGFASGSVIQEFGYDDDVDEAVRAQIEEETGQELVDEDYRDIVDGAVAWWRDEDGDVDDLADLFLDMKANLESDVSPCWVLVPGTRSPGYVTADVIKDADVVVIDPQRLWTVEAEKFYTRGSHSPFVGRKLKGKAVLTVVDGEIVMKDGVVVK